MPQEQATRFEWRETPHGRWQRDLDECEEFYRSAANEPGGCFPVTGYASFQTTTVDEHRIEEALQKAWATLQCQHPNLGTRIIYDEERKLWKREYVSPKETSGGAGSVPASFKVVDTTQDALEWFNTGTTPKAPALYVVRTNGAPTKREIFLRCPHHTTDGLGIMMLLGQLFDNAAKVCEGQDAFTQRNWGSELARLSPSLRLAVPTSDALLDLSAERFAQIQVKNGALYNHPAHLGLPPVSTVPPTTNNSIHRVSATIPGAATGQILQACKSAVPNVSVTHILTSALSIVLSQYQPRKETSYTARYVGHSMINLRPYCVHPFNKPEYAAGTYHTVSAQALAIDVVVPALSEGTDHADLNDLLEIAHKVRGFYQNILAVNSDGVFEQAILAPSMFEAISQAHNSATANVKPPPYCPVSLSSMGNIDNLVANHYGPLSLQKVWAVSEPLGVGVALFLGTWNGELELSGTFDGRYHSSACVQELLDRIVICIRDYFSIQ